MYLSFFHIYTFLLFKLSTIFNSLWRHDVCLSLMCLLCLMCLCSCFVNLMFSIQKSKLQKIPLPTPHRPHCIWTKHGLGPGLLSRTDLCSVSYHCLCRPLLGEFLFSAEPTKRMQVFTIKSIFLFFLFCNNNNENFFFSERSSDMFMELFGETSSQSPMARVTVSLNIMK